MRIEGLLNHCAEMPWKNILNIEESIAIFIICIGGYQGKGEMV